MSAADILPELPKHLDEIESITRKIFGPGMFARAAFVLREGFWAEPSLSFVAIVDGVIVGSVRQTLCQVADKPILLLGPLGVLPSHKNTGIGAALMDAAITAAREYQPANRPQIILLVGDHDYYAPFGFVRVAQDKILLPRPVDVGRLLALELVSGSLKTLAGEARCRR